MAKTQEERAVFAEMGKRYSTKRVSDQTAYTIGLRDQYRLQLLEAGATEALLLLLDTKRTELTTALGLKQTAKSGALASTRNERGIFDTSNVHVQMLNELVPMLVETLKIKDIAKDEVRPTEPLRRSTAKMTFHLERIRPIVESLNEQLAPHFKGKSPLEVHDQLIRDLKANQASQSSKQSSSPNETFEVNVIKGELVQGVDHLNRIGHVAFIEQEHIASQFNRDILNRRNRRKGSAEDSGEPEDLDDDDETTDPGTAEVTEPK